VSSFLEKVCSLLKLAETDLTQFYIHARHPFHCEQTPHSPSSHISEELLNSENAKMGYLGSRFSSVLPTYDPAPNPFKLLASVNQKQWMFFLVCLCPIFPHSASRPESKRFPDRILCVDVGCLRLLHGVLDYQRPRNTVP
jgi:hypothetical protein